VPIEPTEPPISAGPNPDELKVFDHGFVRLDDSMATDLSVINSARVSFAVRKEEMDDKDAGLIKFLMRDRHGSPFEHNSFRFHIRTPIFVAREWFRHRIGCLTGDTVVKFEDNTGCASAPLSKTMEELYRMWHFGEMNGHRLSEDDEHRIEALGSDGHSIRSIAGELRIGRRAVTRCLSEGSTQLRDARWRVRKMRLRVLNEETNEFTTGTISDVVDKGYQPIYSLELEDGKSIKATENHRLLTDEGWKTLREAVGLVGSGFDARATRSCRLLTNGTKAYSDRSWLEARRNEGLSVQEIADRAGCSYHTIRKWLARHDLRFKPEERNFRPGDRPWNDGRKGYKVKRTWTPEWKDAIKKARSGPNSNFWRGGVSSERANIARWTTEHAAEVHFQFDYTCQSCGSRGGLLHAHHIIPVWADISLARDIGNLISVCDACHKQIHRTQASEVAFAERFEEFVGKAQELKDLPVRKGYRLMAHPVAVASIRYLGIEQTYDLCVEGPWHNFVANGMVVHNSFNEESARYHKLADDFYVPDPAAVRGQVGKPGAYTFESVDDELAQETRERLQRIYADLYTEYNTMMEQGVAKELARAVLPFGIYTQFYWTLNARSLMNFLSLRNSEFAQYEIRVYAEAVERFFAEKMPVTHACFVEFGRRSP